MRVARVCLQLPYVLTKQIVGVQRVRAPPSSLTSFCDSSRSPLTTTTPRRRSRCATLATASAEFGSSSARSLVTTAASMSQNPRSYGKGSKCPAREPGTLRLYSMRFCPYVKRVRLVLATKKIPYEIVNINLDDKPEWYLAIHPEGKVPVLENDGLFLTESAVVTDYLDEVYREFGTLNPADPYEKAQEKMILANTFPKITGAMFKSYVNRDTAKEAFEEALPAFHILEKELERKNSSYFGGNKPSMLDYMMWPWFEIFMVVHNFLGDQFVLALIIPKEKFPRLVGWMNDMLTLPAVKELHDPVTFGHYFESVKLGQRNFDVDL